MTDEGQRLNEAFSFDELSRRVMDRLPPRPAVPEPGYDRAALDEHEQRRTMLITSRHVPAKDIDAIMAGSLVGQALEFAKQFRNDEERRILVLSGEKGTGKTTAGAWIVAQDPPTPASMRHLYNAKGRWFGELHPRFVSSSDLQTVGLYDHERQAPLKVCSVLAVDDLGMEYRDSKGVFLAVLDAILDARYRAMLWTVITTNILEMKEFVEQYGQRLADRIVEFGAWQTVTERVRGRR
jgi:DNA replication protein DnaC